MASKEDAAIGREAARPWQIPWRGWKDILIRVKDELARDNISMLAAGVAFYALLALFPALAALVALWGLFAEPQTATQEIGAMLSVLPPAAQELIGAQLGKLAQSSGGALGLGAAIGILVSLWSASSGMKAVIAALDIAYDEDETRGFVRLNLVALGLTLGMIVFVVVALTLVAAVPAAIRLVGMEGPLRWVVSLLRWPVLFGLVLAALAALYRWAPDRDQARWDWLSPGAMLAAALWLLGSIAFSLYVSFFGSYNETYGALAGVVILMTWLLLGSYAVLLGAEINAEMERQTRSDTTTGPGKRLGERGAHSADTVARRRREE